MCNKIELGSVVHIGTRALHHVEWLVPTRLDLFLILCLHDQTKGKSNSKG